MSTITKRILSLVLSFVMLIGMLPINALAEDNAEGMPAVSVVDAAADGTEGSSVGGDGTEQNPEVILDENQENPDVNPDEGQENPGEGQENPGEGQENPGEGQENPGEGQENPGEGQENPGEGQENPGEGQENPGEGQENPGEGQENPGEGQENPGEGQENPGEGQGNPDENVGDTEEDTEGTENTEDTEEETEETEDDANEIETDESEEDALLSIVRDGETPLAVVYAASDFQAENTAGTADSVDKGKSNMNAIIAKMQDDGYQKGTVSGALFCGDYTANFNTWKTSTDAGDKTKSLAASNAGANAVEAVLSEQWGLTDAEVVYVQGNHDYAGFDNMDVKGANEFEHYSVYVLHEDDFQWKQGDTQANSGNTNPQGAAQNAADELETYLKAKADEKYDQPIFVASHVPLHFGYRTTSAKGGDNIYAKYIFDVLNKYGADLDIIFLFGHNHSSDYDDYLGGGAVYLPVGAQIQIPNTGSNSTYTSYELKFTYMNAGYVGYYGGACSIGLSSTVFEIYEDKVVIARYTADGLANLKVAGVDDSSSFAPNTTVYSSTQSIDPMKTFNVDLDYGTLSSGMMAVGNTGDLTVKGLYNTTYNVTWTSSDDSIASVTPSADGMSATVTANGVGTAKITAVATETGTAKAVGDQITLDHTIEVVDSIEGMKVTLLEAGEHTFFQMVDNVEIGKTYAFIDIEDEGYLIGQQQALHYNADIDAKKEGDVAGSATDSAKQELNASGENVFQLPVGGELLTLADITNKNCWWVADVAKEDGNTGGTIRTYTDRTYNYLFAIEGDGDFLDRDADQDRIATGNEKEASSTGGAHWYYDKTHGLVTNHKTDGFQFALYYSQANTDFSAYRINHNGDHGDSKFNESGVLNNEDVHSRVYPFEQVTLTISQPITGQLTGTSGYVNKDVGYTDDDGKRLGGAQTGDTILINDGTLTTEIPVTIDMLSGTFDVTIPSTYSDLTVTYAGVELSNEYTLTVRDSATILKNDAAREYMDTIYTRVDKWYPGRQYLVVDTNKEGIGHAMGVTSGKVTAHNVLVQNLPVDGKDMLYIDASRYSNKADETAAGLVGRGITDQGNINEYFNGASINKANYYKSIGLVWTVTQRFFPLTGDYEISDVRNKDYYFLQSQSQVSQNAANRTLYIGANAEDNQLKLGSQSERAGKETDDPAGTSLDWWWELWQYSTSTGVHLTPKQVNHAYLFYNWQNVDGSNSTTNAANKNFQTEEAKSGDFTLNTYRRTWIYERVTNIDTISARISDKTTSVMRRIEGQSEATHGATFTGDYILVDTTHANGTVTTEQVPIVISMLSGSYDLTNVGTYSNLTVTYQGKTICTDYTLVVNEFTAKDNPEFPNEGAVRVDKQLDTNKYNYLETGVASIDLSVTGIPAQTGVDLVVILDASSSMQNCPHGGYAVDDSCGTCGTVEYNETRMGLMEATLESMLTQLKTPMENGYSPDVDVAIATFNGYTVINSDYEFWYSGTKYDGTGSDLTHNSGQQAEEERPDASQILLPFTNIANVDPSFKNVNTTGRDIAYNKGTNYDRAMELAYQLLKEKQELNAVNGVTRDAVVVFMSDGAPYQYNYFQGDPNVPSWANFLNGTLTASSAGVTNQSAAVQNAFKKYDYHIAKGGSANKHWMAEAIKGNPETKYTIIDRHAMTTDHMTEVNGLGATMYSIGFGLAADHVVTYDICTEVLKNMATDANHYKPAADGEALEKAFSEIAGTVRSAGNAVFHDQMGKQFDLVISNKINIIDDQGKAETVDLTGNKPTITVKSYPLYKRSEIGKTVDGVKVTQTMVGSRKPGEPTIMETITFNDDGSVVSSDKKTGNILNGKVIEAATFFYNTDKENAQEITVNNKTVSLAPETFYWNIGSIPEEELVLSYSVYLNGSMEGLREQGTYDTNEYANLTYTNYMGKECELKTVSPKLPWNQGTVGYGFYLVNDKGEPIINQSNGTVGSFEQSIRITQPVYKDFYLNSVGADILAEVIEADDVMPDGYTLFDTGAAYEVLLESDGKGHYDVESTANVLTTYVVGIQENAFKPEPFADASAKYATENYLTANTIVWFAVKAETKAVPDTVVIDYGLPVEIDVLANDIMLGDHGKLKYVIDESDYMNGQTIPEGQKLWEFLQNVPVRNTPGFSTESDPGDYGTMEVVKDTNGKTNGKVRYTLNTDNGMQMAAEDTFVYAAEYTGTVGAQGHYLSTVTVIPATSIYYEDSFVTYSGAWTVAGTSLSGSNQAQDRPGEFSLPLVDANNIYGYDGAYKEMATYSMGSAKKVTVDAANPATATFTFNGTGFDVISLTSHDSGSIVVSVKGNDTGSTFKKNYMVDTYYGYKYEMSHVVYEYDVAHDQNGNPISTGKWMKHIVEEKPADIGTEIPAEPKEGDKYYSYEMAWIVDSETSGTLYQVPVIKVKDLPYGNYTATITAAYAEALDHRKDGSYDFYLDAIRIYDPANDGAGNDTIKDAYVSDGEGWPEYFELRNQIISSKDFDALEAGEQKTGIIFLDDTKNTNEYTVTDYTNYGPNNELYLAPNQSIAFNLAVPDPDGDCDIAEIHLAMKSVGDTANVEYYTAKKTGATVQIDDRKTMTVATATDMYYDITALNNKTVVVKNTGGSILSITNVKVTYTDVHTDSIEANYFKTTAQSAEVAVASLMMMMRPPVAPEEPEVPESSEPVPEIPEPEESIPEAEPEAFEPRRFDVRLSKNSVKVGQKVTVTVTTSKDVDYITVNGSEVTKYSGSRFGNTRTWQLQLKAEEAGELDVAVVCYNRDKLASAPVVKTVKVADKKAFEPKRFDVRLSDTSVKAGSKVTVTVTTDKDVEYITVNGSKVTRYSGSRFGGTRTWQVRVNAKDVGEMDVTVVCYNRDKVASAPVVKTVTVTKKYTNVNNAMQDFFAGYFDKFWGRR